MQALIAANPAAVAAASKSGRLPIHLALERGPKADGELVAALVKANPGASIELARSSDGQRSILHFALLAQASAGAVSAILAAKPAAAAEVAKDRRLPLHFAAQHAATAEVVAALIAAHPAAAGTRDKARKLPIDHAISRKASAGVVAELLKCHPASATERDERGKLRLHAAVAQGAAPDVAAEMLRVNPASLCDIVENEKYAEAVFETVKRDQSVAYARDATGRPAINLAATGLCKQRMFEALFLLGRYEVLNRDTPKHRSATCVVLFGLDHGGAQASGGPSQSVCLKFMRNKDQFEREQAVRVSAGAAKAAAAAAADGGGAAATASLLDPEYVLPLLRAHVLDDAELFTADGSTFRYLLVMERAEDDLAGAIAHQRMKIDDARAAALSLGKCVAHMHSKGLLHGARLRAFSAGVKLMVIAVGGCHLLLARSHGALL